MMSHEHELEMRCGCFDPEPDMIPCPDCDENTVEDCLTCEGLGEIPDLTTDEELRDIMQGGCDE